MTREEAIEKFERQLSGAMVVLDSGFGTRPGENNRLYRERKEMAEIALAALRAQQEAEKNEPLTLNELREMDGEPVWVDCIDSDGYGCWMLVNVPNEGLNNRVYCAVFENYGVEWLAYRRKPKEDM